MPVDNYEVERRAEVLSLRQDLLRELDGRLSANGIRQRRRAYRRHSLALIIARRTAITLFRTADILFAIALIAIFSPLLLGLLIAATICGGGIQKQERLGRWAVHFQMYELQLPQGAFLAGFKSIRRLPALCNVVRGEMSLIGPRPISPYEELAERRVAWKRYNLRPGLVSLWWIRKQANIAYSSEASLDSEYVETKSFWGDLGIAARAIPALFYGGGSNSTPAQINFLGVRIDNLTMAEASAQIVTMAQQKRSSQVAFVNADCVNAACIDESYRAILSQAEMVLADGIGIRIAGAILDQNVCENVNGTDMLPYLCAAIEKAKIGLYLLGGKPGIADDAVKWISEHYPQLIIAGTRHGYFSTQEEAAVIQHINSSEAAVLLVAFGAPRQDKWIADHRDQLRPMASIGVGGLFDFYSGRIPRAPVWIRELGMEWFYRFYQEPRRMWRRYFVGNFNFIWRVLRERSRVRNSQRAEDLTR